MTARRKLACSAAIVALLGGLAAGCAPSEDATESAPAAEAAAQAPVDCASLASLGLDGVRIDVAEAITPDPVWAFPAPSFGGPPGVSAPFCRVAGVIDPEIGFEVWLPPAESWNGKLQNVGNGAYSGSFSYGAAAQALMAGYAAGTTDTGHKDPPGGGFMAAFDASWVEGRPERVESHGHVAHHRLAEVSKALVAAHYGRAQDYAYFTGCSSGGRMGLTEAQLYPEDYDGIVAVAPANNWVRLELTSAWLDTVSPTGGPLAPELIRAVAAAAVARCDVQDGVTDGIISLPETCDFDPAELACTPESEAGVCLTPEQVETARLSHGRRVTAGGLQAYAGPAYGTVFQGAGGAPIPAAATMTARMETAYEWSVESFDFDRDVPALEAELDAVITARNPDLSAFAGRGGKIILWHGWSDQLLSPYNTIDYVEAVKAKLGADATESFLRLYMAPGVAHCAGGPGPDTVDALTALEAWVERGEAPGTLLAQKLPPGGGAPTMSRPLCPYPQVAVYDGSGDPDAAESFACREP